MENLWKLLNFGTRFQLTPITYTEFHTQLELTDKPNIFKLDVNCFNEIFDYLSLKDLCSIGQSCREMQRIAGEYFMRNYELSLKLSTKNGIYTVYSDHGAINIHILTSSFNPFINCITIKHEDLEPIRYIHMHNSEFASINEIDLVCLTIDAAKVKNLRKILPKIEVMKVNQCAVKGDFYKLLKHCTSLKRLYVQHDLGYIIAKDAKWMERNYPKLEKLHLTPQHPFRIHGLYTFFQHNPNIRSFSTSSRCLWDCRNQILACRAQLNRLEIHICDNYYFNLIDMQLICCLLNQLYERNFYKSLHLYAKRVDQQFCEQLCSVSGLERLSIKQFSECYNLPRLVNLKELLLNGRISRGDIEILANSLWNLEYLSISNVTSADILPFMRHSVNLCKIYAHLNDETLHLKKLNKEREKLNRACKVTIYVTSNIFLATKWATTHGVTNLNLVEMKRADMH
ncbi:uncharacterized protein LOC129573428 [Sitodiplosis mosellana]|uniref:uncharacterized protein LOC129573428 n=1 Tax=Sitodiplosis mosellana TaxID=263140 RepID=UPI002444999F|nr:uncharacterized protein LOC129573428 [Sitodiplosis mosellana]